MNRRGFEFSFAWLFAIIVGAVILFLAIFLVTQFIGTEKKVSETIAGRELGILLTPAETNVEEGKFSKITFGGERTINFNCDERGNFGSQEISAGEGTANKFFNKYIFSSSSIKAKELYVFSKSFKMPFKVADLMIIWGSGEKYCFVEPPKGISDEVEELKLPNIETKDSVFECGDDSKVVCFSQTGCDIDVSLNKQSVSKNGEEVYYDNSFGNGLFYGAIISEPKVYECQIKRLTKRMSELALIYGEKGEFVDGKTGCNSGLKEELTALSNNLPVESSRELERIKDKAKEIERKNEISLCEIY